MIRLLAQILKIEKLPADKRRGAYGKLCGMVGIVFNLLLFGGKFLAGFLSHSIAITADAFNNLSDAGSSVVTLVGFKLAEQKPDADHPFGHGRMEYLSGLAIAGVILLMAFELIQDSIDKVIHPVEIVFSPLVLGILVASIAVKCYMAFYNFKVAKKIDSAALRATGIDSLSDCVSTFVILVATIVGHYTDVQIDGVCGIAVGLLIFMAGFNAAKDTLDPLLGQAPDAEFVEQIEKRVMEFDTESIVGVHDLIVHDYGPGRRVISLHAEVPAEGNMLQLHDVIDNLESTLRAEMGCLTTIHMDPVATKDEHVLALKAQCKAIVKSIGESLSLHDFRAVTGDSHTNLIFDVVIPYKFALSDQETTKLIQEKVWEQIGNNYFTVIQVDKKGGI